MMGRDGSMQKSVHQIPLCPIVSNLSSKNYFVTFSAPSELPISLLKSQTYPRFLL